MDDSKTEITDLDGGAAVSKPVPRGAKPKTPDPGDADVLEKLEKHRVEVMIDPQKRERFQEKLRDLINRKRWVADIDQAAMVLGTTKERLREVYWFDEDDRLTPGGLIGVRSAHMPTYPAPHITTKAELAIMQLALGSKMGSDEWTPVPYIGEDDGTLLSDRYEGPSKERGEFMRKVATQHDRVFNEAEDRLKPARTSVIPGYENLTVTRATIGNYMNVGHRLDVEYRSYNGIPIDFKVGLSLQDFAAWLVLQREERPWKPRTFRFYRAALATWIEATYGPDALLDFPLFSAKICDEIDSNETDLSKFKRPESAKVVKGKKTKLKKSSALKKKFFHYLDMKQVHYHLRFRSKSTYAPILDDWLLAGIFTGLRPIEWRATYVDEGVGEVTGDPYCFLYVMNAKATNGRSNGVVRTIDIKALAPHIIDVIRRMSETGFDYYQKGKYEYLQLMCSKLLTQACVSIFSAKGNKYSLYSVRHQFIANCKAIYLDPEEIAAMAGHKDVMVNMEAYGRRRNGWDTQHLGSYPRPSMQDLMEVHKVTNRKARDNEKYARIALGRNIIPPDAHLNETTRSDVGESEASTRMTEVTGWRPVG